MLLSIALIMLIGLASGYICRRLKLPGLLGMIITGIIAVLFLLGISFRGDCSVPESTALSESEWHELLKEIERYET